MPQIQACTSGPKLLKRFTMHFFHLLELIVFRLDAERVVFDEKTVTEKESELHSLKIF